MKKQANRKAIVISAVLTALLLTFAGGTALAANRLLGQPQQVVAVSAGQQAKAEAPADATDGQLVAAYQARLEQAYQALDEAYAQIDSLQAAQGRAPAQPFFGEDEANEHSHEGHRASNGGFVLGSGDNDHD